MSIDNSDRHLVPHHAGAHGHGAGADGHAHGGGQLTGWREPGQRTMLAPVAYSETALPALRLAKSARQVRTIARVLFLMLAATIGFVAVAPWQQTVRGSGNVIAFAPVDRQQTIESPIKGRIVRLGEGIVENARVVQGQLIAEIRDLDADYADRLEAQLTNTKETVRYAKDQIRAATDARDAAERLVDVYRRQEASYVDVKSSTEKAQNFYVAAAVQKVAAVKETLEIEKASIPQLEQEYERMVELEKQDNIALQKVQEVEAKLNAQRGKVRKAENDVAAAEEDLLGKQQDREAYISKAQADVDYAHGLFQKAQSDASKAEGDIAKAQSELAKNEKELQEMERKVAVQSNQMLTAPMDGYVVQITPNFMSAVLKEGDPICTIVPDTSDRAVQLWLKGNDVPLVKSGQHVRLQFEGWPAVQFSGWPMVAVGTFGARVVSVDASDDGKGKFRILIQPDPSDEPWPSERFLRQGVRANGWVLLEVVPLWWEVWRQLNGFPPVITPEGDGASDSKSKPPKIK